MKRIIYFVLAILVCGIYVGCSENEIDLYDQTPRINFYSSTHVRTLVDTDYVKIDDPYAVDSFTVRIQGDLLKENRDFCVKVTPNSDYQNSVDVLLESKYTYTELDTVCQVFYYKINRPKVESGRNVYGCYLEFDLDNPLHQFDKGLVEKSGKIGYLAVIVIISICLLWMYANVCGMIWKMRMLTRSNKLTKNTLKQEILLF